MEMKGYPFLEHHVKTAFDLFIVSDIMTSPVVVVREIETAGQLEKLLASTNVCGFPVVKDTTEEYVGFIRRDQVVALLECSVFMEEKKQDLTQSALIMNVLKDAHHKNFHRVLLRDDDIYTGRSKHTVRTSRMSSNVDWLQDNFLRTREGDHVMVGADDILPMRQSILSVGSTSVDLSEDGALIVNLAPGDAHKHVDISAAMNRGAYAVVENTPLSKAYKLFAALGLRTLPVLGDGGKVVGILSRSNFEPDFMSERTGMDMHQ
jgi:predicted transcriptional regulator